MTVGTVLYVIFQHSIEKAQKDDNQNRPLCHNQQRST